MYTKAQQRAELVNRLTAEKIHFDGAVLDSQLDVRWTTTTAVTSLAVLEVNIP